MVHNVSCRVKPPHLTAQKYIEWPSSFALPCEIHDAIRRLFVQSKSRDGIERLIAALPVSPLFAVGVLRRDGKAHCSAARISSSHVAASSAADVTPTRALAA
mmetsp:Transcript_42050/g.110738  ORF Transcript_42050/g.110738 Transcript_42050/m.110738 type:complete len:102 (-) Transcript_42050:247-552(-)